MVRNTDIMTFLLQLQNVRVFIVLSAFYLIVNLKKVHCKWLSFMLPINSQCYIQLNTTNCATVIGDLQITWLPQFRAKQFKDFLRPKLPFFPDQSCHLSAKLWTKSKSTGWLCFDWVWSDYKNNSNRNIISAQISRSQHWFFNFFRPNSEIQGLFQALKTITKLQGLFQTSSTEAPWEYNGYSQ